MVKDSEVAIQRDNIEEDTVTGVVYLLKLYAYAGIVRNCECDFLVSTPINQWMPTQVFCLFRRVRQRSCGPGDHPLRFWNVGPV